MEKHILIASHDILLQQGLCAVFSDENMNILCVELSTVIASDISYDLIVVDMLKPETVTLEKIRFANRNVSIPILVLHTSLSAQDKVLLYRAGAAALLDRTAALEICEAQAQALIRLHTERGCSQSTNLFIFGTDLIVDPSCRIVKEKGKILNLTRKEFDLLLYFVQNPKQILTFEQLCEDIWKEELNKRRLRTLKAHICTLRKKMSSVGKKYIQNI